MTAMSVAPQPARKLTSAAVGIPARLLDFSFPEDSPRYFYAGNGFATIFFSVLSGFFPPGERFFVESVRHYRDRISDPRLQAEVSGFIGQEAIHGREHERMNAMFTRRGIAVATADRLVRLGLSVLEKLPASQQLACTIWMEDFTAALAEELLTNEQFRRDADPEMLKIWTWHALEELEHKAVAYDVYEQVCGRYWQRLAAGPLVVAALAPALVGSMVWMLHKEGQLFNGEGNARGLRTLFGKRGFFARVPKRMAPFHVRGFHPHQHDTRPLERTWRERLFGANGELLAEFSNRKAVEATFSAAG